MLHRSSIFPILASESSGKLTLKRRNLNLWHRKTCVLVYSAFCQLIMITFPNFSVSTMTNAPLDP